MNSKLKKTYKTLLENKLNAKLLINESMPSISKTWKALRNLIGRSFMNTFPTREAFLEHISRFNLNDPLNRMSIRIRPSGDTGWGKTGAAARFIAELNQHWTKPGQIVEVIINVEGAHIAVSSTGEYYYMHPEDGYMLLPDGFNPMTDDIPDSFGHVSWFEGDVYKSPILGTATGAALLGVGITDQIINQNPWHPPMELPPDFEGIPQYGSGYIPPYISRPIEDTAM